MPSIPTDTTYDTLLAAIVTKLEAITSVAEVIVGTYGAVDLEHRTAGEFPCIEIVGNSYAGQNYIDQRNIRNIFSFRINAHRYTAIADRIDGTDMKALESLAAVIRTQLFSFLDDVSVPCTGYRMTLADYNINLQYQEHTDNINTAEIDINFLVDIDDTTA